MLKFIDVYTSLCYTFLNKIIEISDKKLNLTGFI